MWNTYCGAGAIGGRGGAETEGTILTAVDCLGGESSILECQSENSSICLSQEVATVTCQGE